MKEKYALVSLFCGAGGLDLGFKLTGMFDIIFGNDILVSAVETYSANFEINRVTSRFNASDLPAVFSGDIADVEFNDLEGLQPEVVSGGPPCQDFSIVRGPQTERSGLAVSRGRLYSHFIRALIHLQPCIFVFENVPGLRSANRGRAYEIILEDFSDLSIRWDEIRKLVGNASNAKPSSYEVIHKDLVDSSKLGVPQRRKRLIIIGVRKDFAQHKWWKIDALREKIAKALRGDKRLLSKYPLTTLEVFEGKSLLDLQSKYVNIMKEYQDVAGEVGTPKALEWKRNVWDKLTFNVIDDYFTLNGIQPSDKNQVHEAFAEHVELLKELGYYGRNVSDLNCTDGSNKVPRESEEVRERMKKIPPNENHQFVRGTEWEVEGRGFSLIYRRVHPLKPSYTVVAYGGGGTWGYHYERSRSKLTSRERARLQTFPDEFMFEGNFSQVRAQIGEAVPPLMAKRIAETVLEVLRELT